MLRRNWFIYFSLIILSAWIAIPYLVGSPIDNEDVQFSIVSAIHRFRNFPSSMFFEPFWNSSIGLGLPHPFGQTLSHHPIFGLTAFFSMSTVAYLFLWLHFSILTIGAYGLAREYNVWNFGAFSFAMTLLLSGASLNYIYSDFWITAFVAWSMFPLSLYLCSRLSTSNSNKQRCFFTLAIALVNAFQVVNSHLGYYSILAVAQFLFLLFQLRLIPVLWFLGAGVIAGVMSVDWLYFLLEGLRSFDPTLPRISQGPLPALDQIKSILFGTLTHLRYAFGQGLLPVGDYRRAYVGIFLFIALFAARSKLKFGDRHLNAIDLITLLFFTFSFVDPAGPIKIISASWLLRDVFVLTLVLRIFTVLSISIKERKVVVYLVWFHLIQTLLAALPIWMTSLSPRCDSHGYHCLTTGIDGPIGRWIAEMTAPEPTQRIYLSKEIDLSLDSQKLNAYGLSRATLPIMGRAVINYRYIKGHSTDVLYPDLWWGYGQIKAQASLQTDIAALNTIGARYLLAYSGERVAEDLKQISRYQVPDGTELVLLKNMSACDRITEVESSSPAPFKKHCEHNRFFCRDFSGMRRTKCLNSVTDANGSISIDTRLVNPGAVLLVSELWNKNWKVEGPADIKSYSGAMIELKVKSSAESLVLRYSDSKLRVLSCLSWIAIAVVLIACIFMSKYSIRGKETELREKI